MNFAIQRHTPIRKTKRRVTQETDNDGLACWAKNAKQGDTLDIKVDELDYEILRQLKGHIRIDGKWKAFVIHNPGKLEFLHCGAAPSLL